VSELDGVAERRDSLIWGRDVDVHKRVDGAMQVIRRALVERGTGRQARAKTA
jgi:hypothetical protein